MALGSLSCSVPLLLDAVACMFRKRISQQEDRRSFTLSRIRFFKQTYGKHAAKGTVAGHSGSTAFQSFCRSLVRRKAALSMDQLWFMITTASDLQRGRCLGNVLSTYITSLCDGASDWKAFDNDGTYTSTLDMVRADL